MARMIPERMSLQESTSTAWKPGILLKPRRWCYWNKVMLAWEIVVSCKRPGRIFDSKVRPFLSWAYLSGKILLTSNQSSYNWSTNTFCTKGIRNEIVPFSLTLNPEGGMRYLAIISGAFPLDKVMTCKKTHQKPWKQRKHEKVFSFIVGAYTGIGFFGFFLGSISL